MRIIVCKHALAQRLYGVNIVGVLEWTQSYRHTVCAIGVRSFAIKLHKLPLVKFIVFPKNIRKCTNISYKNQTE